MEAAARQAQAGLGPAHAQRFQRVRRRPGPAAGQDPGKLRPRRIRGPQEPLRLERLERRRYRRISSARRKPIPPAIASARHGFFWTYFSVDRVARLAWSRIASSASETVSVTAFLAWLRVSWNAAWTPPSLPREVLRVVLDSTLLSLVSVGGRRDQDRPKRAFAWAMHWSFALPLIESQRSTATL